MYSCMIGKAEIPEFSDILIDAAMTAVNIPYF